MKKNIIKTIVFLSIVCILFVNINSVLGYQDDTHTKALFNTFYDLPNDSLDAVWIGASAVQSTIVPSEAYTQSGIAMYTLSCASQPFGFAKYLIKECEKTQDPKVYLIDLRMLAYDADVMGNEIMNEMYVRHVTDSMKFSMNRIELIDYAITEMERLHPEEEINKFDYYFSFTKYHTRWSELTKIDFQEDLDAYMGYYIYDEITSFDKETTLNRIDAATQPISERNERYLKEILDYCDTLDKDVLFTCLPSNQDEIYFARYNYVKDIIQERGYEVLDFNYYVDEINLDYTTDFRENMHMNYRGAIKTTDFVANYLSSRYQFEDHRGEEQYNIYVETQKRLEEDLQGLE